MVADRIDALADALRGVAGVAALNLTTGQRLRLRAGETFPTASAIKVFILHALYASAGVSRYASYPFPSSYSARVRLLQQNTFRNESLTRVGAALMDSSDIVRKLMIRHFIQDAPPVEDLLRDEQRLEEYVCRNVGSTFHPVGTCRLGAESDPEAVADPGGRVIGTRNLYIADASLMPEITRTNTNLPAIMIGEKMADLLTHS